MPLVEIQKSNIDQVTRRLSDENKGFKPDNSMSLTNTPITGMNLRDRLRLYASKRGQTVRR